MTRAHDILNERVDKLVARMEVHDEASVRMVEDVRQIKDVLVSMKDSFVKNDLARRVDALEKHLAKSPR